MVEFASADQVITLVESKDEVVARVTPEGILLEPVEGPVILVIIVPADVVSGDSETVVVIVVTLSLSIRPQFGSR